MYQKDFLDDVAAVLGVASFWQNIKLGTDGAKPTATDGDIKGAQVAGSGLSIQVAGNQIKVSALQLPVESGTVREIGIFGAGGQLQDRVITPELAPESGVRVDVTYIVEVVGEGII